MKKNAFILISLGAAVLLTVAVFMKDFNPSSVPKTEPNCLDCHRLPNINTNEGVIASKAFCLECHAEAMLSVRKAGDADVSLMVAADHLPKGPHGPIACIQCHTDVARSPHMASDTADCIGCHAVHGEGEAHAPHLILY